jgi:uncharacterized protein YacL
LLVAVGIAVVASLNNVPEKAQYRIEIIIGIVVASAIIGWLITPYITIVPYRWVRDQIRHAEVSDIIAGVIGLIVGLTTAALASIVLSGITFLNLGRWLPTIVALIFAYIGIATAIVRKDDFARLFSSLFTAGRSSRRAAREERERDNEEHEEAEERSASASANGTGRLRDRFGRKNTRDTNKILVDTSAIIDGRIADISQTGFVFGALVVPRFVLEELQHIADSSDSLRRNRGRRGLEILQRLQKDANVPVEISDADAEGIHEVDAKLVKLARQWHCPIITNDFNLNRVAELQGVKVLNINELAHAVKPILLPGEEMAIKIMQDGKELGQGVGYLDDGTMIVVEGGKSFMGNTVDVTVTRVLQTVAGRMIFAHPKQAASSPTPARRTGTA